MSNEFKTKVKKEKCKYCKEYFEIFLMEHLQNCKSFQEELRAIEKQRRPKEVGE